MINTIYLTQDENRVTRAEVRQLEAGDFPENDVIVAVEYSTLNFKDALAITGKSPVVRQFPMVPGIDLAGTVVSSRSPQWQVNDKVIVNGWGLGEKYWGGLAQQAHVKSEWLTPLPVGMDTKQAMSIGTAGYTAMLCALALQQQGITPDGGPVLVTGAGGGVGGIAIGILAQRGYEVVASTGRMAESDYLKSLGASRIIDRATLSEKGKPLQQEQWQGAIDCVGSHTLANVCASLRYGGAVAACGLAQGLDFPASVAPFILRGVRLIGIDSVYAKPESRLQAWGELAKVLPGLHLDTVAQEITLADVIPQSVKQLEGRVRGRLVVNVNA